MTLVVVGCAAEPTTTDEYSTLEQELAAADQQLAEVNQELGQAQAQVAAVTADMRRYLTGDLPSGHTVT